MIIGTYFDPDSAAALAFAAHTIQQTGAANDLFSRFLWENGLLTNLVINS